MSLEVTSLASGSSGNSYLFTTPDGCILVDAGMAARSLASTLTKRGAAASRLLGILLTHEHDDHVRGLRAAVNRTNAPVIANTATLQQAVVKCGELDSRELPTGTETRIGPFTIRSFPVSHDAVETVGYVVSAMGSTVTIATDLGIPNHYLHDALLKSNLCILESNHDIDCLRNGPYPYHMKARVASDTGHLSNRVAAEVIARRLEDGGPTHVWLAHLSRVNNSPELARKTVTSFISKFCKVPCGIEVALRDHPSVSWSPRRKFEQLSLFDSAS